jgi:hypothetical protein
MGTEDKHSSEFADLCNQGKGERRYPKIEFVADAKYGEQNLKTIGPIDVTSVY